MAKDISVSLRNLGMFTNSSAKAIVKAISRVRIQTVAAILSGMCSMNFSAKKGASPPQYYLP
ncbi:MAG: hypothetical protein DRQ62_14095 [Gammaproteobacteria bacterium]|nr:MAG: hypothetical protein DRQ62_14095 [Gammaproteobacteria bacterium]